MRPTMHADKLVFLIWMGYKNELDLSSVVFFFSQEKFYEIYGIFVSWFSYLHISRTQRARGHSCVDPRRSKSTRWISSSRNKYPSFRSRRSRRRQTRRFNRTLLSVSLAGSTYRTDRSSDVDPRHRSRILTFDPRYSNVIQHPTAHGAAVTSENETLLLNLFNF